MTGKESSPERSPGAEDTSERVRIAKRLPFALHAWWMREHRQGEGLTLGMLDTITTPLQCMHSDPVCDLGNLDFVLE